MTTTQLQIGSEFSSKKPNDSLKLSTDSKRSTTGRNKKHRKTRHRKTDPEDSDSNSSSESDSNESAVVKPDPPRRKKRRMKKRKNISSTNRSTPESLATLGREYGNNVSKQNVSKMPERSQPMTKLNHSVSSKTAASREYGDFFSWQSGLSYLETNRVDQIHSKGIKRFTDEYMKKLKKCEEFESSHSVKPFASVRLKLLDENRNKNNVQDDGVTGRWNNVSVPNVVDSDHNKTDETIITTPTSDTPNETKNLSTAALKTIEIINKFKSGRSIEADLIVKKKKESVVDETKNGSRQSVLRSGAVNKARNMSNEKTKSGTVEEKGVKKPTSSSETTNDTETKDIVLKKLNKSLEKFPKSPESVRKINERLPSIEETPSTESLILSIEENSTESLKSTTPTANKSRQSISPRHGYVLMKKVLTSSENTVTIVNGKKRYDSKNQKVESHYSGRMPVSGRNNVAAGNEKSLKSIETLYRTDDVNTPRNDRTRSSVTRRIQ